MKDDKKLNDFVNKKVNSIIYTEAYKFLKDEVEQDIMGQVSRAMYDEVQRRVAYKVEGVLEENSAFVDAVAQRFIDTHITDVNGSIEKNVTKAFEGFTADYLEKCISTSDFLISNKLNYMIAKKLDALILAKVTSVIDDAIQDGISKLNNEE